jgi:hypothetical protein
MTISLTKRIGLDHNPAEVIPKKGRHVEKTHTSLGEGEKNVKWINK